ncbi:MAG: hypothetical protein C0623_12505 [Desulfuromonas sp.]|nr:MAG: hypothetical protein C0623_12505 [Desulfuromonas sp.]
MRLLRRNDTGRKILSGLFLALLAGVGFLLIGSTGCREVPVDRLYALQLDHAPTENDWMTALPRQVAVRGGFRNMPSRLGAIDEDTVHTSTASCHHGAALPDPVVVDLRAFYTARDLYIRLSWSDPTRDDHLRQWQYDGKDWSARPGFEDGFGMMWDAQGSFPQFSCSYACHIEDFGVSGANFHARNRMRLARENSLVDLWNWKADRTGRAGFVDDRYLTMKSMEPDVPGDIFHPNSVYAQSGREPFVQGDAPLYDYDEQPIASAFRLSGSVAPGYLVDPPVAGRADIRATSEYRDGGWTVVLRRALDTGDRRDVVFVPGDEQGVSYGLSIMDNTLDQHYASSTEEKLVLMAKTQLPRGDVK